MKFIIYPKRFIALFLFTALFLSPHIVSAEKKKETEFTVTSFRSRHDSGEVADFQITFSKDIIDKELLYTELPKNTVMITPSVEVKARWVAMYRIGIFLEGTLGPSSEYVFEISKDIDPSGTLVLTGQRKFNHVTTSFRVEHAKLEFHYDKDLRKAKAVGTVTFNYPVKVDGLEEYLSIVSGRDVEIPYAFQPQSAVTRTVLIETEEIQHLLEGRLIQAKIGKGFKCAGTEIGIEKDSVAPIQIGQFQQLRIDGADFLQRDGKLFLRFRFSSQITVEMFQNQISIEPKLPFRLVADRSYLEVHGDFENRSEYTVTINNGIASENGFLRNTYVQTVKVPDLLPRIYFTDDTYFLPRKSDLNLNIVTSNIENVGIGISKVYLSKLPTLVHQGELPIESKLNEVISTTIPLKEYLTDKHAGVFKVVVHSDKGRKGYAEQLVLITDLGIVAKRIDKEIYVWVNSLDSLEPIRNATVQLINNSDKQVLLSKETDPTGHVRFDLEPDLLSNEPEFLLTATKDDDFSLLQLQRHEFSTSGFNVYGSPYLKDGHEAFLYTDRSIYRPGETVNLVGIVRGKNSQVPALLPVRIEILYPSDAKFQEIEIKTDEEGACEVQIPLPAHVPTGKYYVRMSSGKKQLGYDFFQVEEFMPDRMKVSVETDKEVYILGDEVKVEVKAMNLFGTPAVGRKVNTFYDLESIWYTPPNSYFSVKKWSDFNFTDPTRTFQYKQVDLNETVTDIEGKAVYQFTLPEGLKPPITLRGYIQTTVQEPGGRAVTHGKELTIHPYTHYVGIKQQKPGTVKQHEETKFDYIVIDTDGNPIADRTLQVTISKIDYPHRWGTQTDPTVKQLESFTLKSGSDITDISFTPISLGVHRVEIEDVDGGAKVSMQFYVSEWGGVPWSVDNPNTLDMTLDKKSYRPGEEAKLEIKPPFPGKVLLTIERDKVLSHQTYMVNEKTATLTIPVEDSFAPNTYLSAILIRSTKSLDRNAPARAFGIVPLRIDTDMHKLQVEIDVPKQIRPNTEIDIKFLVRGERRGKPYRVTIAAVDEGILQLINMQTPDPHPHLYRKRKLETTSYEFHHAITRDCQFPINPIDSLDDLLNLAISASDKRRMMAEKSMVQEHVGRISAFSGAGMGLAGGRVIGDSFALRGRALGKLNTDAVVRVVSLALWSGLLETDADGRGSVRFKVPQFNGTLRVMAVAFSGPDYGSATEQIQVREPVMITPSFPRFLSGGDQIRVPVSIYNGTDKNVNFKVNLQAAGPVQLLTDFGDLVNKDSIQKQVEIGANKEGHLYFDVIAHDAVGIATFHLAASGNGEEIQHAPIRLPLRSAAPPVTKTGFGIVREGEPDDFIFPSNFREDSSEFMLTISPLPTLRFASGLRYLIQYPHGCLEQTTSRVFPLLYLSDLAKIVEPSLAEDGKIDEYIMAGITRLEDMLLSNHRFEYWRGRRTVNNWSSIYAAHFLVEARKAGYKVSNLMYNRMLEGLRTQAKQGGTINRPKEKSDRYTLTQATYACYVLAAAGQPEKSVMHYLRNNRLSELHDYSQFHLAGAFALIGDLDIALTMLPDEIDLVITTRRDTGRNFDSSIRAQAIILNVLVEIKENHPTVQKLVESLTNAASKGQRWGTTQENAYAFLALGKFLKKQSHKKFTGTIHRNDAHFANFDSSGKQFIGSDWDGSQMKLSVKGNGTCYYYWEAFGIRRDSHIEEYGRGLHISRRYLTPDKSQVKNVFKQGELVVAEIIVKALTSDLENVAVIDMLPAGLEIENPRLVSRAGRPFMAQHNELPRRAPEVPRIIAPEASTSSMKQQVFKPDYIDIRDDRLLFYGSFQYQREHVFYYPLRVVTEGRFTVPPVSAEAMYDPSKSAVASTGTIQVIK